MVVTTAFGGHQVHDKHQHHLDCTTNQSHLPLACQTLEDGPFNRSTTTTMAEGISKNGSSMRESNAEDHVPRRASSFATSSSSPLSANASSSSRSRPKLGRSSTSTWFNKSFDQAVLMQETKPSRHRQMRRQSSVSDFFQSMLSRSKSHIVGMLKRKDKSNADSVSIGERATARPRCSPEPLRVHRTPKDSELTSPSHVKRKSDASIGHLHSNSDMFRVSEDKSSLSGRTHEHLKTTAEDDSKVPSSTHGFAVLRSSEQLRRLKSFDGQMVNRSPPRTKPQIDVSHDPDDNVLKTSTEGCPTSANFSSPERENHSRIQRKISLQSQPTHERRSSSEMKGSNSASGQRLISSAPIGRSSLEKSRHSLKVNNDVAMFKRALVKSNSETLTTESVGQLPLSKASSDGNCFKMDAFPSPDGPQSVCISRITNYLFLGSVEAAYSEPLLCKHNISSLIDMSNTPSTDVPLHKKTDCPCPCVNKNHFRSKLNIGIDDIEWENLEQYYDVVNAFINGARKKGGRILIFSYMGQSRAAAATIQHLMCHFRIPFNEAYYIVRTKRPQIKINSGFLKALRRLEKTLGLTPEDRGYNNQTPTPSIHRQSSEDAMELSKGLHEVKGESNESTFPHVVRGAWLEC